MPELLFEAWADSDELQAKLLDLLVKELSLNGLGDEAGFECSLGATVYNGGTFFWRSRDLDEAPKAERWQIISPVRGAEHGVDALSWLLLAEGHLTRRLFGDMLRRIWALPVPAG